jgi:hypothetical protein
MQAVTLLHMAITAKKPVLAVGFGAFLYIYSLATQGCKYHMLNGKKYVTDQIFEISFIN